MKRVPLGSFHTTGNLVVSDPCYVTKHTEWDEEWEAFSTRRDADSRVFEPHNEGGEELEVVPGHWNVFVDHAGLGNLALYVLYGDGHSGAQFEHEFDLGVDAGLMGIYDTETASKTWDYMEFIRHDEDMLYPFGPIVSTGGDGTFPVYVARDDDGRVVGIKVDFS